jgi:DNA-binding GntR family transcriptional regulator
VPLRDLVYEAVRHAIEAGHFQPGEHLSEHRLTRQLGISRTPIREALRRLEADLWLERRRAGLVVASLSAQDIADLFAVKELLEVHAVRPAIQRIRPSQIAELRRINRAYRQACQAGMIERVVEHNLDFHRCLTELAGNRLLSSMADMLAERMRLLTPLLRSDPAMMVAAADDHDAMVDAIEQGQPDEAERHVRAHLQHASTSYTRQLGGAAGEDESTNTS